MSGISIYPGDLLALRRLIERCSFSTAAPENDPNDASLLIITNLDEGSDRKAFSDVTESNSMIVLISKQDDEQCDGEVGKIQLA